MAAEDADGPVAGGAPAGLPAVLPPLPMFPAALPPVLPAAPLVPPPELPLAAFPPPPVFPAVPADDPPVPGVEDVPPPAHAAANTAAIASPKTGLGTIDVTRDSSLLKVLLMAG